MVESHISSRGTTPLHLLPHMLVSAASPKYQIPRLCSFDRSLILATPAATRYLSPSQKLVSRKVGGVMLIQ
jgi:hypothetical protein